MSASVLALAAGLLEALAGFDPGLLSGDDCARVSEGLAATEKACGAARLLAAARAVDCGVHHHRGFKEGAAWLARQSGVTVSHARQALETADRLADCPDTKAALQAGQVSLSQAAEIVRAETETAGAEAALLDGARRSDLSTLRERARHYRQAHPTWPICTAASRTPATSATGGTGSAWSVSPGALPPESGLPLVRRIDLAAHGGRRADRQSGRQPERLEACAADAVAALAAGNGPDRTRRGDRVELVMVCDLYAWRRGHAHPGEVCHIIDGGPIPVSVAKQLSGDAFLKAALHDGVAIHTVAHFGRHRPAELQTALDLGPIPDFTGAACADCGRRWGLEWDHVNPVANGGPTAYSNLQPRCWADHQAKTDRDRQAGLLSSNPP